MKRIFLVVVIALIGEWSPLPAHAQSPYQPNEQRLANTCATLAGLTQKFAEEANENGVPARETDAYRRMWLAASAPVAVAADNIAARLADELRPNLSPGVLGRWSVLGYCANVPESLLIGPAVKKVGHACNSVPSDEIGACIDRVLQQAVSQANHAGHPSKATADLVLIAGYKSNAGFH